MGNNPRLHDSLPPLLRGIGTTVILLATLVSGLYAHADVAKRKARQQAALEQRKAALETNQLNTLSREVAELRSTVQDDETVVEEVLENPGFELFGLLGSAVFASSFYAEWLIKRPNKTI